MSGKLVGVTRLRRRQPAQVVLVHGLFSNSAFWLSELGKLDGFQVAMLDIDYARVLEEEVPLDELARQARELIGAAPAHLICHSFGGWLGARIGLPFLSRAFICPTFAAEAVDAGAFGAEIAGRLGVGHDQVAPLVARAAAYKAAVDPPPRVTPRDELYLPVDDPFFTFAAPPGVAAASYRGGHFDVSTPMAAIARRLGAAG